MGEEKSAEIGDKHRLRSRNNNFKHELMIFPG